MQLTTAGQDLVNNLSQRYNLNTDSVLHMLIAVNNGAGSMAQFNCYQLGGSGQWMRGGMTMVGDMFNNGLKNTVDNLCNELSNALANQQIFVPPAKNSPSHNQWWPAGLGSPFSSGSQNNTRYAIFPNRLAIESNQHVTVYDTLDHNIGGISQQQGGNTNLTFNSQYGTIAVNSLPIINGNETQQPEPINTNFAEAPQTEPEITYQQPADITTEPQVDTNANLMTENQESSNDIINLIKQLSQLHQAGVLSEQEYGAKKAELLKRL
ncbi:SHOCT domain-containing protein [Algibacillus agarilyticus]|uniref:SHOCT domain-containing protein n=1 Tax=Algibacillus agarilyticus TaxID=2234133 RepID=UPI000DD008BA|nr:SHOCT domain-containing protein [Algibacillus agarilyticus]